LVSKLWHREGRNAIILLCKITDNHIRRIFHVVNIQLIVPMLHRAIEFFQPRGVNFQEERRTV
jgi:hypothetical protein